MYFNRLKEALETVLQRNAKFNVNGKILREGRVILYNLKDFYIEFIIITKKDVRKVYEIPVPFTISVQKDTVYFDYTLKSICKDDYDNSVNIKLISATLGKKSKLFDSVLAIELG
tara:strand:+ start:2229 stop:2573 length:345 start_codon:yes stop_codon:yes gene_type:complete